RAAATQLALAIGCAFGLLLGEALGSQDIARITGRGRRSGVGIAGFDQGGLLLDGGPRADGSRAPPAAPPPLRARFVLPPAWRVVLALDPRVQGLAGDAERAALDTLPPLPRE